MKEKYERHPVSKRTLELITRRADKEGKFGCRSEKRPNSKQWMNTPLI